MTTTPAPRFVWVATIAAAVSLILSVTVVVVIQRQNAAEANRDCQRSVGYRNDSRAMWQYLVDTASSGDQDKVDAFVIELNKRLPVLTCRDGDLVPVKP